MTERQYHPVANLFPLLSGEEFESLTNDIAEHGLRDPICLHTDGSIIDGRNRYRACLAAGVKPDFYTFDGTDAELLPYVLSLNLHRRHLNPTQLGFVGAEVEEYYAAEARKRQATSTGGATPQLLANLQEAGGDAKKGNAQDHAAEAVGTSARGIARAKKIRREGAPEIVSACIDGTLRATDAAEILDLSHDEQRQCLEAVQQGQARTVTRARKATPAQPQSRWTPEELLLKGKMDAGETVVVNQKRHKSLIAWAQSERRYIRIDRNTKWGNPFLLGPDGDRDEVCELYGQQYLPHKRSLLRALDELRGKALGCWCQPERCHGHELLRALEEVTDG